MYCVGFASAHLSILVFEHLRFSETKIYNVLS